MSINDPLGDLLTRIRNGQAARLTHVRVGQQLRTLGLQERVVRLQGANARQRLRRLADVVLESIKAASTPAYKDKF